MESRSWLKTVSLTTVLLQGLLALHAAAADVPPPESKPQVIALIATIGDQLTVARKRSARASHVEAYTRRAVPIDSQELNYAVLRGLDNALALDEPASRRVMLRWRANEALSEQLKSADIKDRDALMLEALREQLRQMPQRAEWDRIEAIMPRYSWVEQDGLPRRIGGVGIYVQPQGNPWPVFDEDGVERTKEYEADKYQTVNPRTGERGKDSNFVAPFVYLDRVTLDARSLEVLARKSQFSNAKYSDPKSASANLSDQISPDEVIAHLSALVERAAYQSVRGKAEVEVGPLRPLPAEGTAKP